MIPTFWRLTEAGPDNLGVACTNDGLLLGHTSLIERRNGKYVARERHEIERLFKRAYHGQPPIDRLMDGLARVATLSTPTTNVWRESPRCICGFPI
jgi:hypothetical protein